MTIEITRAGPASVAAAVPVIVEDACPYHGSDTQQNQIP